MEYLVVTDSDDVVGGLHVKSDGVVEFNVPFRLLLAKGVRFSDSSDYDAETLQQTINRFGFARGAGRWKDIRVITAHVPAGVFYPRIARPSTDHPQDIPSGYGLNSNHIIEYHQAIVSLKSLLKLFVEIADVVYPTRSNLSAYGPRIRNLLILSCTEFEAAAKAVLRENGYTPRKTNIQDYHKLESAMRLSSYSIRLLEFPEIDLIRPFEDWKTDQSLEQGNRVWN